MNNGNMNYQNNQQNENTNQQSTYQQPVYHQVPRNPHDGRGFSIASLVIGCCAVVLCWTPVMNIILLACGIIAIIMGAKGRKMSIMAYGRPSGLATAGLVLGIIGTVITGIGAVSCLACASCYSCAACETASALGAMY